MAGPQFATTQVLRLGPTNTLYLAGIEDANGSIATATTNFKQRPSGLLVAEPVDANGIPLTTSRITTSLTTTPLAASAIYEQPAWQDAQALAVNYVGGSVRADESGTLTVEFSDDGTNIAATTTLLAFTPTTAGTANSQTIPYPVQIPTRYFRFVYTNGSTAQGTFALYQTPLAHWSPRDVGLTGSLGLLDSSTTTLGASGTYTTSNAFGLSGYKSMVGSAYSDQSGTLLVEQSQDGMNWDVRSTITVTGGSPSAGFDVDVVGTYGRLNYTNGATAQTAFRLYARGKTL